MQIKVVWVMLFKANDGTHTSFGQDGLIDLDTGIQRFVAQMSVNLLEKRLGGCSIVTLLQMDEPFFYGRIDIFVARDNLSEFMEGGELFGQLQ